MNEKKKHSPKHCPECGGTQIGIVPCWRHSQWMAEPSNPDWKPFQGTTYDTWCYDCETSFDISPGKEMNVYWFDEHPEDLPEEGNKEYTKVLLKRSYGEGAERCGNCNHFFSGTVETDGPYYKFEAYCKLDKELDARYYKECLFEQTQFIVREEQS